MEEREACEKREREDLCRLRVAESSVDDEKKPIAAFIFVGHWRR